MVRVLISALSFLTVSLLFIGTGDADFCECTVTATAPEGVLFACPQGDGDTLAGRGLTVTVTMLDCLGAPAANIPPSSIWLESCTGALTACGGSAKVFPSAPTDANGQATITGAFVVGGCDNGGVRVRVFHEIPGPMTGGLICESECTVPIRVRSADLNGDLTINLIDFSTFGVSYTSPPKAYNACADYFSPFGTVTLGDFAKYASHSGHHC
jgi:hypothetical protein